MLKQCSQMLTKAAPLVRGLVFFDVFFVVFDPFLGVSEKGIALEKSGFLWRMSLLLFPGVRITERNAAELYTVLERISRTREKALSRLCELVAYGRVIEGFSFK